MVNPASSQPATAWAIQTQGLTKRYRNLAALDALDLAVPRSAIGLLGANGAGKSTLIKCLLGLTTPDAGDARVLGLDTRTDALAIRRLVGYMPEADCLPMDATAADFVAHMAEVSGLPRRAARQRAADVLYHVGLEEQRYRPIKGFSTGMKQRVKLAQAIAHDPHLVFLDEPTTGLDPQGRDDMLDLVSRIHRMMGISVVLSSHILDDIERVCDHVVILDHGRLVADQPITAQVASTDLIVRVDGDPQLVANRLNLRGLSAEVPIGTSHILVASADDLTHDLVRDVTADLGVGLRELRGRTRSLEDLYFENVDSGAVR